MFYHFMSLTDQDKMLLRGQTCNLVAAFPQIGSTNGKSGKMYSVTQEEQSQKHMNIWTSKWTLFRQAMNNFSHYLPKKPYLYILSGAAFTKTQINICVLKQYILEWGIGKSGKLLMTLLQFWGENFSKLDAKV